jgi:hypothetical protein
MATLAVDPPEWPWTQEEMDAYIAQVLAEAETVPSAPEHYATQADPMVPVQEDIRSDLNGDGIGDILAADPNFGPTHAAFGRVIVISGWFGDLGSLMDVTSDEAGDSFGQVVLGIDDINGDLIDDLAVGASTSNLGAQNGGRVDVYSGATGDLILRIVGNEANGRLGASIASAGDCNGDGINDLIVGEPHTDAVRGRAFVFYGAGGLGAAGVVTRSPADADLSLTDNLAGAQFGLSVAGVGDLDGDGAPDLAVGSPNRSMIDPEEVGDGVLERVGGVRVYSGATGERLLTINGTVENSWLGRVSMGGVDLDGDGAGDLLISAPGFPVESTVPAQSPPSTDGHVYILTHAAIAQLEAGASITADQIGLELAPPATPQFQFGIQVDPSHDADGDGIGDVLVYSMTPVEIQAADLPEGFDLGAAGLPTNLPIYTMEMRTHVYSGATGSLLYSYNSDEGSEVEINIPYPGPVVVEQVSQVTPIGDVTLDGVVDIDDLWQTVTNLGQPAGVSPTTDVNQNGVTEADDVAIVSDVIATLDAMDNCITLVQQGVFGTVCECIQELYTGSDPGGLGGTGDPNVTDCDDDGGEEPPADGGGGEPENCEAEMELPEGPEGCVQYAMDLAGCEFGPEKDGLDAAQDGINADSAAADAARDAARSAARSAKDAARANSQAAADAAMAWVALPASQRALGNSIAFGAVGVGATSAGTIMVFSATASTGVGLIFIVIGGGVMLWRLDAAAADLNALITNTRVGFEGNAFGNPGTGYASQPTFANGAQLPTNLWVAVLNAGADWNVAREAFYTAWNDAGAAWAAAMQAIESRQEMLNQQRQACEEAKAAREVELRTSCLEEFEL